MKISKLFVTVLVVLLLIENCFAQEIEIASVKKRIAVTFDDLPFNRTRNTENEEMRMWIEKLIKKIKPINFKFRKKTWQRK